ncbi:MAG: VTT domain-containing protein [Spirochaetia bacterium]|nr:VTT domain-containing protein [Spirochaetia bacterium]
MLADLTALLLIAASTFVSEDLTSIGAGIAAASGKVSFAVALIGSMLGIFVGDLLLFAAGRTLGRAALSYAPLKWFIDASAVERSSRWFQERGGTLIFSSRFIPGMRLPTYFAAGVLHVSLFSFLGYFALAAVIWTPLIVGAAYLIGDRITQLFQTSNGLLVLTATGLALYGSIRLILSLTTYRGRRNIVGWFKRLKWEFWPSWMAYPPIVVYCAFLAVKHRRAVPFTSCNPGIPASGLVGESKYDILKQLPSSAIAKSLFLGSELSDLDRSRLVKRFAAKAFPKHPLVIKPDRGERGKGVRIVRNQADLIDALAVRHDCIVQEYVPGIEFGIMYVRLPSQPHGRIISITRKIMPVIAGDGIHTLEHLILSDARAVCLASHYLHVNRHALDRIPSKGESIQLVELGTHSKGSIFLDGSDLISKPLSHKIDQISRHFKGFYLGRYDVRVPDENDLRQGKNIKIVELNGVTSEPTHIYDPQISIFKAYGALLDHWRLAYQIGIENISQGHAPWTISELIGLLWTEWKNRSGIIGDA